jgi:hypothetical protein
MINKKNQWYEKLEEAIMDADIDSIFKLLLTIAVNE